MQRPFIFIPRRPCLFAVIQTAVLLACFLWCSSSLPAEENETAKPEPFRLDLVPDDALGVFALRPAQLLAEPAFKPARALIAEEQKENPGFARAGLLPADLQSVMAIYLPLQPGKREQRLYQYAVVVQTGPVLKRELLQQRISQPNSVETSYRGKSFRTSSSPAGKSLLFLDDHTFILADQDSALKRVIDQQQNPQGQKWKKRLQAMASKSMAGGVDVSLLRSLSGAGQMDPLTQRVLAWPMLAPLWQNTEIATLGITVQKELSLELTFEQKNDSAQIKQSLEGLLLLGINTIRQFQITRTKMKRPLRPEQEAYLKELEQFLTETQVTQNNTRVTFASSINQGLLSQMVELTIPAFLQARAAARRARSQNNIKLIMLALHSYFLDHGHFPPAVVLGPDGKTPHSWRVELLPYLDQQALYDKYRLNEPWDSPHNLKIAETVVPVFHCPGSKKPANSSYFVIVGNETAFGKKEGVSLKEMTGGTNQAIAVVEAERDVPWTRPEDITYDGKKVPKFGGYHPGGFLVGMSDGSVKFISDLLDDAALKTLLSIKESLPER